MPLIELQFIFSKSQTLIYLSVGTQTWWYTFVGTKRLLSGETQKVVSIQISGVTYDIIAVFEIGQSPHHHTSYNSCISIKFSLAELELCIDETVVVNHH